MPDVRLIDILTEEQYDEVQRRFLETLDDMEIPEGCWDGIVDYVMDAHVHPDFEKK